MNRVAVLGGYGTFGTLICERLLFLHPELDLVVAGRSRGKGQEFVKKLQKDYPSASIEYQHIDLDSAEFPDVLHRSNAKHVIHTCGPFQKRDYTVARACIRSGMNYVDLADSRRFVCDIGELDEAAKAAHISVLTGASSVPSLSSAVIDRFLPRFSSLESVRFSINPGNRCPRGVATVSSVLSYCGKSIPVLDNGSWTETIGWHDLQRAQYPGISPARIVTSVDIPDLELFATRYPSLKTLRFYAGLEVPLLQYGMMALSRLHQWKIIKDPQAFAEALTKASYWFYKWGTDEGAIAMTLSGLDLDHKPLTIQWSWFGGTAHGPYIAASASVALVSRLIKRPETVPIGAMPAVGILQVSDFEEVLKGLDIHEYLDANSSYTYDVPSISSTETFDDKKPWKTAVAPSQTVPTTSATLNSPTPTTESGSEPHLPPIPLVSALASAPVVDDLTPEDLRSALGKGFGTTSLLRLPKFMRRFHTVGGRVTGTMDVIRGRGLANLFATLGGLPREAKDVSVEVVAASDRWDRVFVAALGNGQVRTDKLTSKWECSDGLVYEKFFPFTFGFQMKCVETPNGFGFLHVTKRMWVLGIPVPRWLMLRPDGSTLPLPQGREGWFVDVNCKAPLLGTLVRYKGVVYRDDRVA